MLVLLVNSQWLTVSGQESGVHRVEGRESKTSEVLKFGININS